MDTSLKTIILGLFSWYILICLKSNKNFNRIDFFMKNFIAQSYSACSQTQMFQISRNCQIVFIKPIVFKSGNFYNKGLAFEMILKIKMF